MNGGAKKCAVRGEPNDLSRLEALPGLRCGHAGVVDVDDAPARWKFAIDLSFAAMSCDGIAVFPKPGVEIPVELRPGRISVDVDANVARRELSLRKGLSHQARVDVRLDLVEAVFVP